MARWALPIILGENFITRPRITAATSEDGINLKENIADFRLFSIWKGTSNAVQEIDIDFGSLKFVDTAAFANHDLFTQGANIEILWADDAAYTVNLTPAGNSSPSDDNQFHINLTPETKQFWRIRITNQTAATFLGLVWLGKKITMEKRAQNFTLNPDPLQGFTSNNLSEEGQALGTDEHRVHRFHRPQFVGLTDVFVQANLKGAAGFINTWYIRGRPFFLIPDETNFPTFIHYLWPPKDPKDNLVPDGIKWNYILIGSGVRLSEFV